MQLGQFRQVCDDVFADPVGKILLLGLAAARAFFTAHPIGLGAIAAGESITMDYFLGYKSGTSAVVGDGFGFTYDLATAPVAKTLGLGTAASSVPEPSTWALLSGGLGVLAFWSRKLN